MIFNYSNNYITVELIILLVIPNHFVLLVALILANCYHSVVVVVFVVCSVDKADKEDKDIQP